MVAVVPEHRAWLQDSLDADADQVEFVDMMKLGHNPARIIPAWQKFLDKHEGRPVRGIGEPIWPGRRPAELLECQLHEALLNVAVDPKIPFWLVCPYHAQELDAEVIEEAHRSHPVIVETDSYAGSLRYGGRAHVDAMFGADLATPPGVPITTTFTADNVARLLAYLRLELYVAGLPAGKASQLAGAAQRLAQNSLHRGAREGRIRIWNTGDALICEINDETAVDDVLHGRREPFGEDHDALWLANQVCDLVQLRSTPSGTTVRVHAWR
jgi:MEDS: MEthanogen/methylotroph, DcmR Sensory domain